MQHFDFRRQLQAGMDFASANVANLNCSDQSKANECLNDALLLVRGNKMFGRQGVTFFSSLIATHAVRP